MTENKRIIHILIITGLLFLVLMGYLTYFQLFVGSRIVSNPYNRRHVEFEDNTLRGGIYDREGIVLASSRKNEEKQDRIYHYGALYSQIIGYNSGVYGKSLLEDRFDDYLLNRNAGSDLFGLRNALADGDKKGNDLYLTLDHKLQVFCEKLIRGKNGAVVVMNPKTGEILAMVSKPDFETDSRKLEEKWENLVESKEHPFVPRATQGLYAPGSTYKVLISAAALEKGMDDRVFEDKGSITIDGKLIRNQGSKAYGEIDIDRALAVSSNVVFSELAVELGAENLMNTAERFWFGKEVPFDLPVSTSRFPYSSMSMADMAATGIGQGKMVVTPLHMAMVASAIANEGIMMKPLLVKRVATPGGTELKSFRHRELDRIVDTDIAGKLKDMMFEAVKSGTGKSASVKGINVAGKTGTAENEMTAKDSKKEHAWFIGFAPVEDPQIAIAIILEYSGLTGSQGAAPIAGKIMAEYLK